MHEYLLFYKSINMNFYIVLESISMFILYVYFTCFEKKPFTYFRIKNIYCTCTISILFIISLLSVASNTVSYGETTETYLVFLARLIKIIIEIKCMHND